VEQRYAEFLKQFPAVAKLARAREQTVLAAWSGLGYYRRARALHAAAKTIQRQRVFPRSAEKLRELPGIGRYTAAAVASIAYGEPVPVVDGNVKRVLQRLSDRNLRDEECWEQAGRLLASDRPGDFNQAMMELGATICLPARPNCSECPVTSLCIAQGKGQTLKPQQQRRKEILNLVLARRNGSVFLKQRARDSSVMPSMWELPSLHARPEEKPTIQLRHSIINTDYQVNVFADGDRPHEQGRWVELCSARRLPLTGLALKILLRLELLPPS
jgi:A/G-specific adenine glycosylase